MTFEAGKSGNPLGKPRGTRCRVTLAVEQLMGDQAAALTQKAVQLALNGDPTALRICLDRIAPIRKGRLVRFIMPKLETAADTVSALSSIVHAVAAGELTTSEASELSNVLEIHRKALETHDIEKRVERLEKARSDAK
jgi:hypothetical protein